MLNSETESYWVISVVAVFSPFFSEAEFVAVFPFAGGGVVPDLALSRAVVLPDVAVLPVAGFLVAELSVLEVTVEMGFAVVADDGFCAITGMLAFTAALTGSTFEVLVIVDGLLTAVFGAVVMGFVGGLTFLVSIFSAVFFVLSSLAWLIDGFFYSPGIFESFLLIVLFYCNCLWIYYLSEYPYF